MKLYIYDERTRDVVAIAEGVDKQECESKAVRANYDDMDRYGWTYSPSFGNACGIFETDNHEKL